MQKIRKIVYFWLKFWSFGHILVFLDDFKTSWFCFSAYGRPRLNQAWKILKDLHGGFPSAKCKMTEYIPSYHSNMHTHISHSSLIYSLKLKKHEVLAQLSNSQAVQNKYSWSKSCKPNNISRIIFELNIKKFIRWRYF